MRFATLVPWLLVAAAPIVTASSDEDQWTRNGTVSDEDQWTRNGTVDGPKQPDGEGSRLSERIWDKVQEGANCVACQGLLDLLRFLTNLGEGEFVSVMQKICKFAKFQDDDVCDGVIALQGPAIARAIHEMRPRGRSSMIFCAAVMGMCPFPKTKIPEEMIPPKRPKWGRRPRPSGLKPFQIVHFSDIHVDQRYTEGAETQCNKPICCRAYTEDDAPGQSRNPAGPFGDHKCDAPVALKESMYKAIKKIVPDAQFAIFTGDIVDHTIWNTSRASHLQYIDDALQKMHMNFDTVFSTVGNHEMHPLNLFPSNELGSADWLYTPLSRFWARWTGRMEAETVEKMGAYSTKWPHPSGKLRIISLNTNMYYRNNFELYRQEMEVDPNGQFAWLMKELEHAERSRERVWIIGHMPMGDIDALHDPSNIFDRLVARYHHTISAMFFGHTHVDHFQLHYKDYRNKKRTKHSVRSVSYIAPSLTPTSGMPSFRVYTVDWDTSAILDYTQYIADMSDPEFQTTGPVWKKYYSAKQTYGEIVNPPLIDPDVEMTPAFWHNVTEVFRKNKYEFSSYLARKSRGLKEPPACTGVCLKNEICWLRGGRAQNNCYMPTFGNQLGRHDDEDIGPHAHNDCGASVGGMLLSHLAMKKATLRELEEMIREFGVDTTDSVFDAV